MINKKNDHIKTIEDWLTNQKTELEGEVVDSIRFCLKKIEELHDENASLWLMLDELKKSEMEEWGKTNKELLQESLDEQVKSLRWRNRSKGEC